MPFYRSEPDRLVGGVVVLHEVWGLLPQIKDVCRRLCKLGFAAAAPDLYWREKNLLTPTKIQKAMEGVWDLSLGERRDFAKVKASITRKQLGAETLAVAALLYSESFRRHLILDAIWAFEQTRVRYHRASILGFCLGGGIALKAAARTKSPRSVVSFYGEPPSQRELARISAPILAIHATKDEIINTKVPAFVENAIAAEKDLTLKVYPHTRHGFFNDTNKSVYNKSAAAEAWELTRWFLDRTLK